MIGVLPTFPQNGAGWWLMNITDAEQVERVLDELTARRKS
jgi:hypothetical protein